MTISDQELINLAVDIDSISDRNALSGTIFMDAQKYCELIRLEIIDQRLKEPEAKQLQENFKHLSEIVQLIIQLRDRNYLAMMEAEKLCKALKQNNDPGKSAAYKEKLIDLAWGLLCAVFVVWAALVLCAGMPIFSGTFIATAGAALIHPILPGSLAAVTGAVSTIIKGGALAHHSLCTFFQPYTNREHLSALVPKLAM